MSFLHWFNFEYWGPSWPNIFAPNIWTILAVLLHLAVTWVQRERQHHQSEARASERHEDMKQHVTNTIGGGDGQADPS